MGNEKDFKFLNQMIGNAEEKLILNEDIKLSGFSERLKFKDSIELKKDNFTNNSKIISFTWRRWSSAIHMHNVG